MNYVLRRHSENVCSRPLRRQGASDAIGILINKTVPLDMNAQLHTPCLQPDADTCRFSPSLGLCPAAVANLHYHPVSDDARLGAVSCAFPCQIPFDLHGRYAQFCSECHN
ncbi:hypothetical protein ARMGADRAFT_73467 [Armillaria gallica]|uniref:Uncharacterized protein n=1 Tax=Armillaria gallica TaxID=47427 RepID=A0A2H3DLM9_ARMGA|nr:hypothetical protein ARMGADRAFT_73467 [Armillaria gallica]